MPSARATASRGRAAVAGQHHDADARRRAARAIASGVVALIGSATPSSPASRPSTATNIDRLRRRRAAPRARVGERRRASTPSSLDQRALPSATAPAVDHADARPCPAIDSKLGAIAERDAARLGARDDRRGQRMLAAALEARREPQQLVLARRRRVGATTRPASACPRSACRSCRRPACRPSRSSSSASAFRNSTPAGAPAARRHHDRHRRRQPERARAGDDQHRDRVDQRVRQPRLRADQRPDDERQRRRPPITAGTKQRGDPVGQPLDRRAAALRLGDHARRSAPAASRRRPARRA